MLKKPLANVQLHSGDPAEFFKDRDIVVNELLRKVWVHSEMVNLEKQYFTEWEPTPTPLP